MNWPRCIVAVVSIATLLGLVTTGCASDLTVGEKVALASERTASLEPQSYRITRHTIWQGPLGLHEEFLEREVVTPDRIRDVKRAYVTWTDAQRQRLFGSERQTVSGCEGKTDVSEVMVIGTTEYNLQCDGSWATAARAEPIRLGKGFYQLSGYWDNIKVLRDVEKVGSVTTGGEVRDVFQGQFTDADGTLHEAKVWVAQEDNVVRRLEEVWPDYTLELEVYDINDPSISIQPPE